MNTITLPPSTTRLSAQGLLFIFVLTMSDA